MSEDTNPTPAEGAAKATATVKKSGRGGARAGAGRPSADDKLLETVTTQLEAIGFTLAAAGAVSGSAALGADGGSVMTHAEPIAQSLVNLAKTNPRVRAFLTSGVEATGWIGVAVAVGPLCRDIYTNHAEAKAERQAAEVTEPEAGAAAHPFEVLQQQSAAAAAQAQANGA